jgi:hypothetical protein
MTKKRKITLAVIFIVLLSASNLIGGFIGFDKGYEARIFHEGLEVIPMIAMLEKLREGKSEFPIKMLEVRLDWQIYNLENNRQSIESIYNSNKYWNRYNEAELATKMMGHAKTYRTKIPSSFEDQDFRKKINDILTKYENHTEQRRQPDAE